MKQLDEKGFEKIINAFRSVYHEKEKVHVDSDWPSNAMKLIRKDRGAYLQIGFFYTFQQFVWKLVPVSCILVMLLGILISQTNFLSDYEMTKIFINDPSDLSFISLYNV
jgi:hypothetical protein